MIYTHLPFEARIFWLNTSKDMQIELYRRKLERGDDVAPGTNSGGLTNDPAKLDAQIERLGKMVEEREVVEKSFTPLTWAKDRAAFNVKVKDMLTKLHHARGELAPHEVMEKLRADPIPRLLYRLFVKPSENKFPKIHNSVHTIVVASYTVAFLWCLICSLYILLYGICGSVSV
jgi:hypothetical protein